MIRKKRKTCLSQEKFPTGPARNSLSEKRRASGVTREDELGQKKETLHLASSCFSRGSPESIQSEFHGLLLVDDTQTLVQVRR
jgi:hypothetical protein